MQRETFFVPCQIAVSMRRARVYVLAGFRAFVRTTRQWDAAVRVTGPDSVHVQGGYLFENNEKKQ